MVYVCCIEVSFQFGHENWAANRIYRIQPNALFTYIKLGVNVLLSFELKQDVWIWHVFNFRPMLVKCSNTK